MLDWPSKKAKKMGGVDKIKVCLLIIIVCPLHRFIFLLIIHSMYTYKAIFIQIANLPLSLSLLSNLQLGVASFLQRWLANGMDYFRLNKLRILLPLASALVSLLDPNVVTSLDLHKWLEKLSDRLVKGIAIVTDPCSEAPSPTAPPPIIGGVDLSTLDVKLMSIDAREMARQITILDSFMYRNIPAYEWLHKSWSGSRYPHTAEHSRNFIDRFNAWSFLVQSEVLQCVKLGDRVATLKYWIEVCRELKKLNNLNSLQALASGLDAHCIKNMLPITMESLGDVYRNELAGYSDIFNATGRYKNYRALEDTIKNTKQNLIPQMSIYLSDITFIEDGNPNKLEIGGVKLINYQKWEMLNGAVYGLKSFQRMKYDFMPVRAICSLINRSLKPFIVFFEEERTAISKSFKTASLQLGEKASSPMGSPTSPAE